MSIVWANILIIIFSISFQADPTFLSDLDFIYLFFFFLLEQLTKFEDREKAVQIVFNQLFKVALIT